MCQNRNRRSQRSDLKPGVGGRILEDGDALELARISPGSRAARSLGNAASPPLVTHVRFLPIAGGTRVMVEAEWADATPHHDGTAIVRVAPARCGNWMSRRPGAARPCRHWPSVSDGPLPATTRDGAVAGHRV